MKMKPIKLKLKLDDPAYVEMLFADNFREDNSPIYPICVASQWAYKDKLLKGSELVEITRYNYRVVEDPSNPNELYKELAKIYIRPYPSFVLVVFEKKETDINDWEKVKLAVREIVNKAEEMEFIITWADPPEFMPKNIIEKRGNQMLENSSKPESVIAPSMPEKPKENAPIDIWFKYYHECKALKIKYTLEDIAKATHHNYGYIRGLHMNYLAKNKDLTESDKKSDNI